MHNVKKIVPTYNVIGFIRGSLEPDRYVIHGNHRDAWVFGSVDPSSATAALLELVRSYSTLLKQGPHLLKFVHLPINYHQTILNPKRKTLHRMATQTEHHIRLVGLR